MDRAKHRRAREDPALQSLECLECLEGLEGFDGP